MSPGAKPYYIHHPYGGGYAIAVVLPLPHFSQDSPAVRLATISFESLATEEMDVLLLSGGEQVLSVLCFV